MKAALRPLHLIVALAAATAGVACGGSNDLTQLFFYEAQRTRQEECTIRSNGEFCVEPEQFDPALNEVWVVERRGDRVFLFLDEEVWLMDAQPEGSDLRTDPHAATRRSELTDGNGCATTKTRSIEFIAEDEQLSGTVRSSSVLQGPPSCGNTPAGERTVDAVTGFVGGP